MHDAFRIPIHFVERHSCYGLNLHPLTIGHRFLLADIGSPFSKSKASVRMSDLLTAALICGQPYRKAREMVRAGRLTFGMRLFAWLWGSIARRMSFEVEFTKFKRYLSENQSFPPLRSTQKEGRSLRSPEDWLLILFLVDTFRLTFEQSLEWPVLRAHAAWVTVGEETGRFQVIGTAEDNGTADHLHEFWKWAEGQDKLFAKN